MSKNKPKLLDLFCGAGGASYGYQLAGFDVSGVDINPQPRHRGDRMSQAQVIGLTYLLDLKVKERGFLDASQQRATEVVLPLLHVRLKSPNALWRLCSYCTKAVLLCKGRGFSPKFSIIGLIVFAFLVFIAGLIWLGVKADDN